MAEVPERFSISSDLTKLGDSEIEGEKIEVGFRPSGSLHVGNLLTIAYAAAISERTVKDLEVTCCDTDWSAHMHENHRAGNNRIMKLFYERECSCGQHENVAEHRMKEIEPFLKALEEYFGININRTYLTDLQGQEGYTDSLRRILRNMDDFDSFYGGGFRRRYISPVTASCDTCGFAHAKGASYSPGTDELVAPCRNRECPKGFISEPLNGQIGVYYLVDPVRDVSAGTAIHVFGGDYRVAEKEQKTSKIVKVAKTTDLACGKTPSYFISPMISDKNGNPLSKSKGTSRTAEDVSDLRKLGEKLAFQTSNWINEQKTHVKQSEI